jgi:hypothetical protein
MRAAIVFTLVVGGCASAGQPSPGTSGDDVEQPMPDARETITPDGCGDDDQDTVCNAADKCPGFDDAKDMDADTVADGCDKCPGADDRIDSNANGKPDCTELVAFTVPLKSVAGNLWRGWHSSTGGHSSSNENTLTGEYTGATYNSYYVFTLAGFTATSIQSVTLQLQLENYGGDASESFTVWDVTTPAATVENTATDVNIYNDLASGVSYGTGMATAAQLNQLLSIPLNNQAAMGATAKLGQDFVVGVHLDTAPGYIRFGHTGTGATPTTIQLAIKYLP